MVRKAFTDFYRRAFHRGRMPLLGLGATAIFLASAPMSIAATQIVGAGSTFDYPFFSKAFYEYSQKHSNVTVNYQSIGSGGGIQQFTARTVDFGATDVPMNSKELSRAPGEVLQIPVTLGGAGIAYNLAGIKKGLHLTREVVADIYLGKITKWNDPAIEKLNPGVKLPDMAITVVHRSDGSGTTYIFTDFLSHVSAEWKQKVGTEKSVQWPAPSSIGGKGNEGVAGLVRQTPGAIGYVELAYLLENNMTYAMLQNKDGKYLYPTIPTVRAAAATKPNVSSTDFSIVDTGCAECYPISGYSWVILYKKPADAERAAFVKQIMNWLVTGGQSLAESVDYVPLPPNVQKQAQEVLAQMQG
ncbi:MAG TPA: phosphate ABC transporter substrate-binding protein PstS [Stellaceae bacterium]|nr:phosphate ABC transporter substrate-binding protein PstS [Stellaceae bacterium]